MVTGAPKKIGKYEVVDIIGKGGMGIVYRAKDPFLDRLVAIKMMTINIAEYPDLLQRFYREAKSTANLKHPNIVTVYELGEHEGSPYLAMEFLEGSSLESMIRGQLQLSTLQKLDIIVQVCHGLSYAHQREIVHRDIKPGNIMVLKDGSVKIVDFGIARIGDTNFTRTGQFMGSLNYMSLEQLNEKLQVDQRTDVYSTGVVLYQLITGALPFEAESTGATLAKIFNEGPPPFGKFLSSFPPELETITLKALSKDRDHRYATADDFATDLSELQDRLKQESVSVHMQQAELLLQQNDLFHAHDELLEVLKIDRQHTRAISLLRTVRKQIEKEQSVERARQLREQAEEAYRREEFDTALVHVEQAISLDTTNAGLQQFRATLQSAKAEAEHLREVLQRAENAHRAGNLDTAKQAIEEVLARRPNDTRVKSLYRMIQKDLEERLKQKRMENLLEAARKEIANRQYTAAFNILKEAEKVDPDAPQLRALLEKFNTAREQEQRRRELEQITRQIEQALNTDDHQSALNLAGEALRRYPNDPSLMKLRDLAETQKQAAQTKSFVREKIAAARESLNAGNAAAALKVLEDALRQTPGNPHLESLLSIAQERIAQDRDEEAKSNCIQQANKAFENKNYAEAIRVLEAGQLHHAASPEIDNLLRFAREQQAKSAQQQEVEGSVRRAQEFLRAQEYDRAIELLESILTKVPDDELNVVLEEARHRRDELNRQIAAAITKGEQFLAEGFPAKALEFLQSQPTSFARSDRFRELVVAAAKQSKAPVPAPVPPPPGQEPEAPEPAKTMMWSSVEAPEIEAPPASTPKVQAPPVQPPPQKLPPKPPKPRTAPLQFTQQQKLMAAAVAAVILLVAMVIVVRKFSGGVGTLSVQTNVGGVDVFIDGQLKGTTDNNHTLKVSLKQGHHEIRVQKQGYEQLPSQAVDLAKNQEAPVSFDLVASTPPPPAVSGTLSITANVDGFDLIVDDAPSGTSPNKTLMVHVSPGSHRIRLDKPGFDVAEQKIDVVADQESSLTFTMKQSLVPPPSTTDAYLLVRGIAGAEIRIDGKPAGKLSGQRGVYVKVVPDSSHRIDVTLDGFKPWSASRSVKPGERQPITAELTSLPRPSIASFEGGPATIQSGQSVKLSWQTTNATDIAIEGVAANLQATGSMSLNPTQTTSYTLTAKGAGGVTDSRKTTITVVAAPTVSITVNPTAIQQGQSTTLSWQAQNATEVTMPGNPGAALTGSVTVSPEKTATFTIEVKGPGGVATGSATVIVQPKTLQSANAEGVRAALDQLQGAYASLNMDEMVKAWPRLKKDKNKKNSLTELFKGVQTLKVRFEQCGTAAFSGDTAKISCTQSMTSVVGEKAQPTTVSPVNIVLKKNHGNWLVNEVNGQ
jgi:serine/threonine protein kinase